LVKKRASFLKAEEDSLNIENLNLKSENIQDQKMAEYTKVKELLIQSRTKAPALYMVPKALLMLSSEAKMLKKKLLNTSMVLLTHLSKASKRGYVDDINMPEDTRAKILNDLTVLKNNGAKAEVLKAIKSSKMPLYPVLS
jgi:hypothetical protein